MMSTNTNNGSPLRGSHDRTEEARALADYLAELLAAPDLITVPEDTGVVRAPCPEHDRCVAAIYPDDTFRCHTSRTNGDTQRRPVWAEIGSGSTRQRMEAWVDQWRERCDAERERLRATGVAFADANRPLSNPTDHGRVARGPKERDAVGVDPELYAKLYTEERTRDEVRRDIRRDEARKRFLPLPRETVAEILKRGVREPEPLVADLHDKGDNTLIEGAHKVGKTTLNLNLVRSLIGDHPFLGRFDVEPLPEGECVGFINLELDEAKMVDWVATSGADTTRIALLNLRGEAWDLRAQVSYDDTVEWAADQNVTALIIDPFAQAFGSDENSNEEVGQWLALLDELKKDAGIRDLFLVTHFGRNHEERARGATRLHDWPDNFWTYTVMRTGPNQDLDYGSPRRFRAMGRSADVPDGSVQFFPNTLELVYTGESRKLVVQNKREDEQEARIAWVLRTVAEHPELGKKDLIDRCRDEPPGDLGRREETWRGAIDAAVDRGWVDPQATGKGKAQRHVLTDEGEGHLDEDDK